MLLRSSTLAVLLGAALSLNVARAAAPETFAPPTNLAATFTKDGHIEVRWRHHATAAGGNFLEFGLGREEEFSLLDIAWSSVTAFHHPDVARDTRFNYRLRPFFGRTSEIVELTTGPAREQRERGEMDGPVPGLAPDPDASASTPGVARPVVKKSLRSVATLAEAAPARLAAKLAFTTTADLRWQDRASDEDGYLVEFSDDGGKTWKVCALLPPDATSFRKTVLPPNTKIQFTVRAFFNGEPTKPISVTTAPAIQ